MDEQPFKVNKYSPKSNAKQWTYATNECYKRNCVCKGCTITPENYHYICHIKYVVIDLIKKCGKPKHKEYKPFSDKNYTVLGYSKKDFNNKLKSLYE